MDDPDALYDAVCDNEIVVPVCNALSHRVATKAGHPPEGVLRHRLTMGGTSVNVSLYSPLLADVPSPPPRDRAEPRS